MRRPASAFPGVSLMFSTTAGHNDVQVKDTYLHPYTSLDGPRPRCAAVLCNRATWINLREQVATVSLINNFAFQILDQPISRYLHLPTLSYFVTEDRNNEL